MGELRLQEQNLLKDFEEFERVFLHPNISNITNINPENNGENHINHMNELEEMEQNFITNQLGDKTFHFGEHFSFNQSDDISYQPMLPNQTNNPYDLTVQDDLPFDPMVLEPINFEIPTSPSQTIDMNSYVHRAVRVWRRVFQESGAECEDSSGSNESDKWVLLRRRRERGLLQREVLGVRREKVDRNAKGY